VAERLGCRLRREGRSFRIPGHGGLILWEGPDGWRWTWFSQGRSGDAISFLQEFAGLSFQEAVEYLAGLSPEPSSSTRPRTKPRPPRPKKPERRRPLADPGKWQEKARAFVKWAHNNLAGPEGEAVRQWLAEKRGIDQETARRVMLGFLPREIRRKRSGWGLPVEDKDRLWLPPGLVIPYRDLQGELSGLQFRIFKPDEARKYGLPSVKTKIRFYFVSPGKRPVFLLGRPGEPLFIVESELDAILLARFVRDYGISVAALGSAGRKPRIEEDLEFYLLFLTAPLVILSLDNDEAGREASSWWLKTYRHVLGRPTPREKDLADFWKIAGDTELERWLWEGVRRAEAELLPGAELNEAERERLAIMIELGGLREEEALARLKEINHAMKKTVAPETTA